ncbi:MAG: aminotransferase class III-fold pyridoxal phosphate-dependent enzyme [Acidobacteria bacterium]|nr:aminotransferase class III-fold pyridoxal phosphate-dependent enzyme [Acidobacteriota bacterium]
MATLEPAPNATAEHSFPLPLYGPRALTVERGEGCYVIDPTGRRYLDFLTGIGVNALGYGHPAILAAMREQVERCVHTSNLHTHPYQNLLAEQLARWSGLNQVFLSNSGTEAMEAAMKAAKARANQRGQRRHRIVALENSFHGKTAGALAMTGQPKYRDPFLPLFPDVVFVPLNNVAALKQAATGDTIAIVAETILGEGGIYPLEASFLSAVRAVAEQRNALWIADETQCGLGRTGERFAYQSFPETGLPDIVVTAKPLGGGLPLGATIFSSAAATAMETGMHGTTFGGGPLACRAAIAFLNEAERLLPSIRRCGDYLHQQLRRLQMTVPRIREIRGRGLMAGIELSVAGEPIVQRALREGLVINCTHGHVLRLLPPYIAREHGPGARSRSSDGGAGQGSEGIDSALPGAVARHRERFRVRVRAAPNHVIAPAHVDREVDLLAPDDISAVEAGIRRPVVRDRRLAVGKHRTGRQRAPGGREHRRARECCLEIEVACADREHVMLQVEGLPGAGIVDAGRGRHALERRAHQARFHLIGRHIDRRSARSLLALAVLLQHPRGSRGGHRRSHTGAAEDDGIADGLSAAIHAETHIVGLIVGLVARHQVVRRLHAGIKQIARRHQIGFHDLVAQRRALGARRRDHVVLALRASYLARGAHGDHIRVIGGRGNGGIALRAERVVAAEIARGYHHHDARLPGLLDGQAQRIRSERAGDEAAERKIDDADVVCAPQRDGAILSLR